MDYTKDYNTIFLKKHLIILGEIWEEKKNKVKKEYYNMSK